MSCALDSHEHPEHYIKLQSGFIKIHCFVYDEVRKVATTFYLNEARGRALPNIEWRIKQVCARMRVACARVRVYLCVCARACICVIV